MEFINFHNHSEYSFLASLLKVEELVSNYNYFGYNAVALTDTLSTFGYYKLTKLCENFNCKPIYGIELFFNGINGKGIYPVIFIALNRTGLKNIFHLNSISYENFIKNNYYHLSKEILSSHNDGLAVIIESEIYFYRNKPDLLSKLIEFYNKYFPDNFYVEVNYTGDKKIPILKEIINIVKQYKLKALATTDNSRDIFEPSAALL